ncbi:MAG: AsmA family protein [Alphaproteobacteria bacterium]|nr:AsmA family protein [Alphaproteobacteria bacterium]
MSASTFDSRPPPWGFRMHPALWTLGGVLGVLLCLVLLLNFLGANALRGPIARYASHRLGRTIHIEGNLKLHLFSFTPGLAAERVTADNPSWAGGGHAAEIGRFAGSVKLLPLFAGRTIVPDLEFDDAHVLWVRDAQGRSNWASSDSSGGTKLPAIRHLVVRNGHLTIDDRVRHMRFDGTIASNEQPGAHGGSFQLSGFGTLNGNRFSAEAHGGALIHVDIDRPYHFAADVRSGATHVAVDGQLARPFHLGQVSATASFEGPSLRDLYDLTGIAFPSTPAYRVSGHIVRDGAHYRLTDIDGKVGGSDLHGTLDVDASQTPMFVQAALTSKRLRFVDLGPLIGAHRSAEASKATQVKAGAKAGASAAKVDVLPDAPLDVTRVRQMNADVRYDAGSIESRDFPLRDLHTHVVLKDGVLTLDPLTFDFVRGKLAGMLRIDARNDVPVTDVDARLSDIHLEQFFKGNPPAVEGLLVARAKLHGSGNTVRKAAATANGAVSFVVPSGGLRQSFAELTGIDLVNGLGLMLSGDKSQTGVRCGVLQFSARGGVLSAQRFTIDTDPVLIEGQGRIDLKDERLALQISGHPKKFRIGRLRAPITIDGTLGHPDIGLKASAALGQGGVATALAVLNPIAALLAFVDPGLAKDANCSALVQSAANGPAPVKAKKSSKS